jgi:hypothetical protein
MDILEKILKYKSLSIIGNYKNVGKTTTLNYIIKQISKYNITLGLTSIGVDGESQDIVTKTKKPRIYVNRGSIIATAKSCVLNSDITKEILEVTNINTPLGFVIIFRALSDGYVELAGPSINNQIKYICERLKLYGANLSIVDGALSRKTLGSPSITDATIFCSGAILNRDIKKAVEQIAYEANVLNTDNICDDEFFKIYDDIKENKVSIVNRDYTQKSLNISTTLNAHKEVYDAIDDDTKYVVINGTITNSFIDNLIKSGYKYKNITILISDSTKIFLDKENYDKFIKLKGCIKVINKVNLIGISINPTSINGYSFNEEDFIENIQSKTNLKVFNVMN